jgi:glycerol kinase
MTPLEKGQNENKLSKKIMNLLTKDFRTSLLGAHESPCLSLYQPTHRHHPENQEDPIRFRNLVKELDQSLQQKYAPQEICALLDIPMEMLPQVKDCAADFGTAAPAHLGAPLPILGVAGDQQAATIGQACFEPGMMKSTYGTGCFALLNTGTTAVKSKNRLLTTIAYQIDGVPTYALEGSIFVAGAVVQWLRDGLGIIANAADADGLAQRADSSQNVILVPAFVGLGAPYWNADCRGATFGLTRGTGPAEMVRAALESVGFQTRDLLEAMNADWQSTAVRPTLRVDGGMAASDWTMQFLADIIDAPVDRPHLTGTTVLGVAWLAGYRAGLYPDMTEFAARWKVESTFSPAMSPETRNSRYAAWGRAVAATLSV